MALSCVLLLCVFTAVEEPTVSVFTTWLGQVGSPLVLPLLSVEGSGMVVGEWDSETMANLFFYDFFSKIFKSHIFREKVIF